MGQQSPRVLSTDPNAGVPLRTSGGGPRVLSTDPNAGEPLRVNVNRAIDHPHARTARIVGEAVRGVWNVANPIEGAKAFGRMVIPEFVARGLGAGDEEASQYGLLNTAANIGRAHADTGARAIEDFQSGDYLTAARRALNALIPIIGPGIDASTDKMMQGRIAEGLGEVVATAGLTAAGMRPKAPTVPGKSRPGRVPRNAAEAEAVQFARQEGIPLDAATATGSQFLRNVQKKAGSSWGGASTAETAQAMQGEALAAAADRLARRANDGGPAVTGVEAGEGVRSALQGRVKRFHGQANEAYSRLREAESQAPEEMVRARPKAPVASHVTTDQSFVLRWLAKDLEDHQFQPSSRTRGARALDDWQQRGYGDEDTSYALRVAGTPVQEMFHAIGIKGSRPEIAVKIEKFLTGQNKDPRFAALADALNQAWDGQNFDFDLVNDDALVALGVRRRDLKSPIGLPDYAEAGAARFFPDSEYTIPDAPSSAGGPGAEAMQLAIDLRPHKEALRPLFDQLQKEREITGTLHGDKARAALALESVINGPDYGSLTAVDRALGPIKRLASGADMRELRSPGQGVAARVAGELDTAVRGRAEAAGPGVSGALAAGRAATRSKHRTAEVMKRIAPNSREPRAIFDALTRNKDAGIAKLRDLQKHVPDEIPNVARAFLEDLFDVPTATGGFTNADGAWARWQKLGPDTKRILFPEPGHVKALDNLLLLAKKIGSNPNPSGTAQVLTATEVLAGIPAAALAKLLYSQAGVRAITGVMDLSVRRPSARVTRAAAVAQLSRAAQEAGVTLELPKAAEAERERQE